jgi:hypothetical protein
VLLEEAVKISKALGASELHSAETDSAPASALAVDDPSTRDGTSLASNTLKVDQHAYAKRKLPFRRFRHQQTPFSNFATM